MIILISLGFSTPKPVGLFCTVGAPSRRNEQRLSKILSDAFHLGEASESFLVARSTSDTITR